MTRPIPDQAQSRSKRNKLYIGTFDSSSRVQTYLDETGIALSLHGRGSAETRKSICMHLHYGLLAEILYQLARSTSSIAPNDWTHRQLLRGAANALACSLDTTGGGKAADQMTPEEEVLLLHILE